MASLTRNPLPQPARTLPAPESNALRTTRRIAGWASSFGVLVLLALAIGWIWSLVELFTTDAVFGYFSGETTTILALFVTCVFYFVFLQVQGVVGLLMRFASKSPPSPNVWAKVVTLGLWLAAAAGMAVIVSQSVIVQRGLTQLDADFTSGKFGR